MLLYTFVETFFSQFLWPVMVQQGKFFICSVVKQLSFHPQLVGNAIVLSGVESENTEVATVCGNVFGDLEVALGKINNAAVVVAAVDKIINNSVLIAFTDQVIKNNDFLIIQGELFKRSNLAVSLDDVVTNSRIDVRAKIIEKEAVFVVMQGFCAEVTFCHTPIQHMQQNICLARVARPAN